MKDHLIPLSPGATDRDGVRLVRSRPVLAGGFLAFPRLVITTPSTEPCFHGPFGQKAQGIGSALGRGLPGVGLGFGSASLFPVQSITGSFYCSHKKGPHFGWESALYDVHAILVGKD
jgi:hypothetical protein